MGTGMKTRRAINADSERNLKFGVYDAKPENPIHHLIASLYRPTSYSRKNKNIKSPIKNQQ